MEMSFIKTINWIDVGAIAVLVTTIFVGMRNGFVSEFFKFLGLVVAIFVSLHYYSFAGAWLLAKTHYVNVYQDVAVCAFLFLGGLFLAKLLRSCLLLLFKVETNHEGFDKYAAMLIAIGRGVLIVSMTIFLMLLSRQEVLTRMITRAYSYKIAGSVVVRTYGFLYQHFIDKLYAGQHYNNAVARVLPAVRI